MTSCRGLRREVHQRLCLFELNALHFRQAVAVVVGGLHQEFDVGREQHLKLPRAEGKWLDTDCVEVGTQLQEPFGARALCAQEGL